jgi:hypothetical protein
MGRDALIAELDNWINSVEPNLVIGDDDSIYLTDWQEGYLSALKEFRGKLLGAD